MSNAIDEHIGWLLTRAADRWPDQEFIVLGDQRLTFGDVWRWSTTVANSLAEWGLRRGDRLLWQLPNGLDAIVLHFAAWRLGLVSVPVVPLYREHELRAIVAQSGPAAVAFDHSSAAGPALREAAKDAAAADGRRPPLIFVTGGDTEPGEYRIPPRPRPEETVTDAGLADPGSPDDMALILFTSGTTNTPKGVMHSSRALLIEADSWHEGIGIDADTVSLMGAPISHIAGMLITMVAPAFFGARAVVMPRWNADEAVDLIDREKVTMTGGAGVFLREIIDRYDDPEFTGHRLATFMSGGANIDPALILRADALGVKSFRSWGMTEAPTVSLARPDDLLERRAHFDGRLVAGAVVQPVDDDRRPLPDGAEGELRLKSGEQMLGYLDPEHHAADTDADGWFYSGDIGVVDADGWVRITGRKKDIINRGGEKFSARDIEECISSHPAVVEAAVIGTPNDRFGEQVTALVVLRDQAVWPGREALWAHLDEVRLAKQKFPVAWRIVDELPKTLSGKVQKHILMKRWHDELADAAEPE